MSGGENHCGENTIPRALVVGPTLTSFPNFNQPFTRATCRRLLRATIAGAIPALACTFVSETASSFTSRFAVGSVVVYNIEVLCVDDDNDFVELAAEFLERANDRLSVESETDPTRVSNRIKLSSVDCLVSDYEMPSLDGLALLEQVREDHPNLPFILFTGKGSEAVASRAVSLGVTGYQRKEPGTDQFRMLANTIEKTVDGQRARRLANERERNLLRYRQAVEVSDDWVVALDRDDRILFVNEAILSAVERDRSAIEGSSLAEILDEETYERVRPQFRNALQGKRSRFRLPYEHRDGEVTTLDVSCYPLRDAAGRIEGSISEARIIPDTAAGDGAPNRARNP